MGDLLFEKYEIVETVESDDLTALYIVEEKETSNKFVLKKVLTDTSNPLYKTAVREFKKVEKEGGDKLDRNPKSPAILNFFFEEDKSYLLLEYKNKKSLRTISAYPSIGKILNNRYVVVRGLASGGFGVVYIVRDLSLPGKYWALKEMQEEGGVSDVIERSFRIEAEMLAALEHPRIPRISDFFVEREKLYLVMDYVEGETLRKKIKNLKAGEFFPESQVIDWGLNLCNVLEYMHSRKNPIIFRDLKPDNIMITPNGELRLIDFGIARVFEGPRSETTKYTLLTAGYAPPEQSLGKAEPRSDIYSLGATLYHLVTGVHPRKVAPSFPPPEEFNPSISPLFAKIISKTLEPKPEERFQTVIELKEELLNLHKYKEAEQHLVKAKEYESKKDYFNANFEYMKALDLFQGGNYEILNSIGRCYEHLGFRDKALEHYKKSIELDVPDKLRGQIEDKIEEIHRLDSTDLSHKDAHKFATRKNLREIERPSRVLGRLEEGERQKGKFSFLFLGVILVIGIVLAVLVHYIIQGRIKHREEGKILFTLKNAKSIYREELEKIETELNIVSGFNSLDEIDLDKLDVDYLEIIEKDALDSVESEIVKKAFEGKPAAGTRLIDKYELEEMGENFYELARIELKHTEKARPVADKVLEKALAMEYAIPLFDEWNMVYGVICGGKIINKNFGLIDKIHERTFENKTYEDKPVGTVTIFLDDVRIATNVLDEEGNRAIGTRASQEVYEKVVIDGEAWIGRAFVVTHWYITAYEPIKNINGDIIGMIYVGYLEDYFMEENKIIVYSFWAIIFFATIFSMIIYIFFNQRNSRKKETKKAEKEKEKPVEKPVEESSEEKDDTTGTTASRTEYKLRGQESYNKGDYVQAIEELTKALTKKPSDPVVSIYLQNSYLALSGTAMNTIGISFPLSGSLEHNGEDLLRGIALAQIDLNKKYSGKNKGIQIIPEDDMSTISGSLKIAGKFTKDDKILAVIANMTSDQCKATAPLYEGGKLVALNPIATYRDRDELGSHIFRMCGKRSEQIDLLAECTVKKLKCSKIAIMYDESQDYSSGMAKSFKKKVSDLGAEVVMEEKFLFSTADFKSHCDKMAEKEPQALFFSGYYKDGAALVGQIKKSLPSIHIIGGGISIHTQAFIDIGGEAVNDIVFSSFFAEEENDKTKKFTETFYNTFKVYPVGTSALAYDAFMILAAAILEGGPSRKIIRDYLSSINSAEKAFDGVTGKTCFDTYNNSQREVKLLTVKKGKFILFKDN